MATIGGDCPLRNEITIDDVPEPAPDLEPSTDPPLPGKALFKMEVGSVPDFDPKGPGYGTRPEDNPQLEPVPGKKNTYESPGGITYEYHEDTDQKWFFPADMPNGKAPQI